MRFRRTLAISALVALLTMALPPLAALAGGWANVTLDALPAEPRAGQALSLGFMVRQHGITPTNSVQPYLSAHNKETGQTVRFTARQEGPVGHFVADVTFPAAGAWEWEASPAPFPTPTKFGTLTVLPAGAAPSQPAVNVPVPAGEAPALAGGAITIPVVLRAVGAALLLVALALALVSWRGAPALPGRLRPLRSR